MSQMPGRSCPKCGSPITASQRFCTNWASYSCCAAIDAAMCHGARAVDVVDASYYL